MTHLSQQDQFPQRCLQGPAYWCQDAETAAECQKEQFCLSFWDTALWDQLEEGALIPKPKIFCTTCIKVIQWLQSKTTIEKAVKRVCRVLGKRLGQACTSLVKKYRDKIINALQNDSDPQDTCRKLRLCLGSQELLDDLS
ncbi:pulmonary surfactant-associated protein B-like isoform X2 [Alligator mississippiensis]|uniref:pulmonary surfactant-associated protein B-like isoform X2 n=1 Tax=Alligator mississippiensis TaxID=8496 RepID=UPI0028773D07|nr:pulmonary surfactant-associated protein B-like isoform X2 [Alligator mississippiensis]